MENGYHLYDFKGELLREEPLEKFKQWAWRPRPPTLLSKEEQKQIRKNLREYSRVFEQEDAERISSADVAVVEARRRLLNEWYAWRESIEEELAEERAALGLPENPVEELLKEKTARVMAEAKEAARADGEKEEQVVEEIMEEVLEETEEIVN
jgi:translation initiation factor 3 subunit B